MESFGTRNTDLAWFSFARHKQHFFRVEKQNYTQTLKVFRFIDKKTFKRRLSAQRFHTRLQCNRWYQLSVGIANKIDFPRR